MFEESKNGGTPPGFKPGSAYPEAMTVSSHSVAVELRGRVPNLGTKKMHKLLYYCQAHHAVIFGVGLFSEPVMAWDMGPVVANLWYDEKNGVTTPELEALDESQLNTIGYVVNRYGHLTGRDLENLTHGEEPWQRANLLRRPHESSRIELDWMREYFSTEDEDERDVVLDSRTVTDWLQGADQRLADQLTHDGTEQILARLARRA